MAERRSFRLTRGLISGKVSLATDLIFPGFDRHHGPPLAGFAVSELLISSELKGGTRQPRRVTAGCESFSDSCRAWFWKRFASRWKLQHAGRGAHRRSHDATLGSVGDRVEEAIRWPVFRRRSFGSNIGSISILIRDMSTHFCVLVYAGSRSLHSKGASEAGKLAQNGPWRKHHFPLSRFFDNVPLWVH